MQKVFYVYSTMSPTGRIKKKAVPTGKKKKLLGFIEVDDKVIEEEFVPTGQSDCQVDGAQLSRDVEAKIAELEANGFVVVNITPVISGAYASRYEFSAKIKAGWGYGYGYSYTDGIMIIAKQLETTTDQQHVSN